MKKSPYLAALLAMTVAPVIAADISVPGDQADIAAAVAAAASGDRILLTQDATPYVLDTIDIPTNLTIEAAEGVEPVIQVDKNAFRGFRVNDGSNFTLRNVVIDGSQKVPGEDAAISIILLQGNNELVVENVEFNDTIARAIDGRNLSAPVTVTVTGSKFQNSGNRQIQMNDIPGGTSTVVITDNVFSGSGDDAVAIRNNAVWDATLERNVFFSPSDPDADAFQIGGLDGSTFLVRDNIVYDWIDDAVQVESNAGAVFNITRNTFLNFGTGVNLDASGSFTGTINFTQNLLVEWNQGLTSGTAAKGYALSALDNDGTWVVTNNALLDAQNDQYSVGSPISIDASNVTGVANLSEIFVSTDPGDPMFLRLAPGSPARDVAGSGLDAGVQFEDGNSGGGGIDYSSFTAEIVVTPEQMASFTGQELSTAQSLRAMGVDPTTGELVFLTSRQKTFTEFDAPSQLVRVDVSDPGNPVFTTILTEPQLLAAANDGDSNPANNLSSNATVVDEDGIIYFSNFEGTDEVLRIDPANPTNIQKLREEDGVSSVFVRNDGSLGLIAFTNFGAPTDKFFSIPSTGGAETLLVDSTDVTDVTFAGAAKLTSGTQLSSGDYFVWDEQFRGGSDQLLRITPSGAVSIEIGIDDIDNGIPGGIEAIVSADDDTLFLWQQFPGPGGTQALFIYPQPTDITTRTIIPLADLNTQLGTTGGRRAAVGATATYSPDANTTYFYWADYNQGFIARLVFQGEDVTPVTLGDLNADGVINVADVTELANRLGNGPLPSLEVGDVNMDGVVDQADVAALASQIVND